MRRRTDAHAVTKAENNYDYADQDPINGYDLDGTMLDRNGIGDCEIGSCGNTFDTNPTGIASVGTIAERVIGKTATRQIKKHWRTAAALTIDTVAGAAGVACGPFVVTCTVVFSGVATAATSHYLEHNDWQHSAANGIMAANGRLIVTSWEYALTGRATGSTFRLVVKTVQRVK